ncbi:ester cyclase [Mangrovivirga sp. M17]|uniref:Ester cyclase n=1 Tax=Mangrovivirga halotolerans TaxID=2993936 RepID=A0ABT3RVP4_9BACT|nr:ester cyclase [Mangrovivirga halotolerans]MCX2745434.1 ester cyclase [Mangrovivirga halotolerans]
MKRPILIISIFFILLAGCHNTQSNSEVVEESNEEKNISLIEKLLTEADNKNVDFMDEVCAPDYKYYFPSNSEPINLEEHKAFWKGFNQAFPDLKHSIEDIYAKDDIVVARLTVRGTLQNEFAGVPPKGQQIEAGQILIIRFKNNKIVELREEADLLGFYQQLGMELKLKENK